MFKNMDTMTLSNDELDILNRIKNWDIYSDIDQLAPSIWERWRTKLAQIVWDEFDADSLLMDTIHLSNHLHV